MVQPFQGEHTEGEITLGRPDDFELIDENEADKESRSLLWLAVTIALIGFGLAAAVAFFTLSSRLNSTPPTSTAPVTGTNTTADATANAIVPLPDDTAQVTVTSSPSATPTFTPVPTITPTPPCIHERDGALTAANDESALGCPLSAPGQIIWAAWEPFERGAMLWRSDTDRAYVFAHDGNWSTVDERWNGEEQPYRGDPPPGLVIPERGFGYIWSASDILFNQLGWATDVEKGFCARVQEFERGFIIQSEAVPSCTTESLFNHGASADWQSIRLVATTDNERWQDAP